MAIAFVNGTQDVDGTEWSLPRDASYSAGVPQTDACVMQGWIDTAGMAAGDEYEVRIYESINGSAQRAIKTTLVGAQAEPLVLPSSIVGEGWDVTIKRTAGATARTFNWSIRKAT